MQCDGAPEWIFTENETNLTRLWGQPNASQYVKDAFHRYVVGGEKNAVNPNKSGTKAAAHLRLEVPAGGSQVVHLRLNNKPSLNPSSDLEETFAARIVDADEFYARVTPASLNEDERRVHRQALAGMVRFHRAVP